MAGGPLLTVLRQGVQIIDQVTGQGGLQTAVTYMRAVEAGDGYGSVSYSAAVALSAIVDRKQRNVKTAQGQLTIATVTLTFLNIDAVLAATGNAGFQLNDKFVLPDGTTGPVLNFGGFVDAGTAQPLPVDVYLG